MSKALKRPKGRKKEETITCPSCRNQIPKYSFKCPRCGRILMKS